MKDSLKDLSEYKEITSDTFRERGFNFFNSNILNFVYDKSIPVLERINYANIVLSNYAEHFGRIMNTLLPWMQAAEISKFKNIAFNINKAIASIEVEAYQNLHIDIPELYDNQESIKDQPVIINNSEIKYIRKSDTKNLVFDGINYVPFTYIRDFTVDYEVQEVGTWSKEYIEDKAYEMDHTYIKVIVAYVNKNISIEKLNSIRDYILSLGYYPIFINVDLLNCMNYEPTEEESELKYTPIVQNREINDYMNQSNFCKVVRLPEDSFDNVIDLYDQAIHDPTVSSIYITIYRTKPYMRLINTLIEGTHLKKKINIYVELTARGDEQNNIDLINRLKAECDPNYLNLYTSYSGYKIHAKIGLIAFDNGKFIAHCGTGNFNEVTAKLYKDTHIITDDVKIVNDVYQCFKSIATKDLRVRFKLKKILKNEIRKEIQKKNLGRIILKCNHIADSEIIDLLILAKQRGCEVKVSPRSTFGYLEKDLGEWEFRGGRFLEHERIYIFGKDNDTRAYMSSSDILFRNLYKRMEFTFKLPSSINIQQFI